MRISILENHRQERIPLQEVAYLECPLNLSIYQIDWQRYLWLS